MSAAMFVAFILLSFVGIMRGSEFVEVSLSFLEKDLANRKLHNIAVHSRQHQPDPDQPTWRLCHSGPRLHEGQAPGLLQ